MEITKNMAPIQFNYHKINHQRFAPNFYKNKQENNIKKCRYFM